MITFDCRLAHVAGYARDRPSMFVLHTSMNDCYYKTGCYAPDGAQRSGAKIGDGKIFVTHSFKTQRQLLFCCTGFNRPGNIIMRQQNIWLPATMYLQTSSLAACDSYPAKQGAWRLFAWKERWCSWRDGRQKKVSKFDLEPILMIY